MNKHTLGMCQKKITSLFLSLACPPGLYISNIWVFVSSNVSRKYNGNISFIIYTKNKKCIVLAHCNYFLYIHMKMMIRTKINKWIALAHWIADEDDIYKNNNRKKKMNTPCLLAGITHQDMISFVFVVSLRPFLVFVMLVVFYCYVLQWKAQAVYVSCCWLGYGMLSVGRSLSNLLLLHCSQRRGMLLWQCNQGGAEQPARVFLLWGP